MLCITLCLILGWTCTYSCYMGSLGNYLSKVPRNMANSWQLPWETLQLPRALSSQQSVLQCIFWRRLTLNGHSLIISGLPVSSDSNFGKVYQAKTLPFNAVAQATKPRKGKEESKEWKTIRPFNRIMFLGTFDRLFPTQSV
jgi:hypothetical protein